MAKDTVCVNGHRAVNPLGQCIEDGCEYNPWYIEEKENTSNEILTRLSQVLDYSPQDIKNMIAQIVKETN